MCKHYFIDCTISTTKESSCTWMEINKKGFIWCLDYFGKTLPSQQRNSREKYFCCDKKTATSHVHINRTRRREKKTISTLKNNSRRLPRWLQWLAVVHVKFLPSHYFPLWMHNLLLSGRQFEYFSSSTSTCLRSAVSVDVAMISLLEKVEGKSAMCRISKAEQRNNFLMPLVALVADFYGNIENAS